MKKSLWAVSAVLASAVFASTAEAQQQRNPNSMGGGDCGANVYNCAQTPNPLPAPSTVWIEEMTWMDVRDALDDGMKTVIIATGGVEPNGPWLATGKHNFVLRANCDAIARRLGDALCAPIIKLVPEGNIDPPSSHMTSPGTISMRQETFEAMLTDVAHSLKMHGFENIIFIGDSGGNQTGMQNVAATLNAKWGKDVVVAHIPQYYDYASVTQYMTAHGVRATESEGMHDDPVISLNMFADDPFSIRYDARVEAGKATINGVSLADRVQNREWARQIVDFRAFHTAGFIEDAILAGGTVPPEPRAQRGGQGRGNFTPPAPDPRDMGGGRCADNVYNCADTPNPLPPTETLWIEEMTWMDVRDALDDGKTTAIIATGGVEPNGPWLVTGKHNYVLRANCPRIAAYLGNALCAPVLELVPEGGIEPQTGHMTSPGTISLRQETFEAVLTDMAESLKQHGFENIVFIGDSGGNQQGMGNVADALNARWSGAARAHFIPEYYRTPEGSRNVLRELGVTRDGMPSDGLHDSPGITLNMMLDDISSVRWAERVAAGEAQINGVDISNLPEALRWAEEIADARSERTAKLIRDRIGGM
ncbi:MAG: creatininase family protein [Gemmatimonadota bacterium]|nr:creatininase family protein [Gemmatimonadota bacterium]